MSDSVKRPQGPNVRRLIAYKMSVLMVPPGSGKRSLAAGVEALVMGNLPAFARHATEWVKMAIAAVKAAPDNPYGDDDETIAGVILAEAERRTNSPHGSKP